MSPELIHCTKAIGYLENGRECLRFAIEGMQNVNGLPVNKAFEVLDWTKRALDQFSLAMHVFENHPEWVEDNYREDEIMKLMKAAMRLQGIVLYNLELMQDTAPTEYVSQHEHMA